MEEFRADATMDGITGKFRYVSPTCMPSSSTTRSPQGSVCHTGLLEFSLLGVACAQRSQESRSQPVVGCSSTAAAAPRDGCGMERSTVKSPPPPPPMTRAAVVAGNYPLSSSSLHLYLPLVMLRALQRCARVKTQDP
jgi:hypothetical protein